MPPKKCIVASKTSTDKEVENEESPKGDSQNETQVGSKRKTSPRIAAYTAMASLKNANKSEKSTAADDDTEKAAGFSNNKNARAKVKKGSKKPAKSTITSKTKGGKKSTDTGKKGGNGETTPTRGKKAKKVPASKCVPECVPGPKSGCCQRSRKRGPDQLSCVEVYDALKKLGVEDFTNLSKCLLGGLMSGCIGLEEEEGLDLDTPMFEWKGLHCDHQVKVTMRKLLYQPDYGGDDYENNGEKATVWCESHGEGEDDCEIGRYYVTGLCGGRPSLDSGKFHNHCDKCPGFGRCLGDYRCHCQIDKKTGRHLNLKGTLFGSWDYDRARRDSDSDSDEMEGLRGQECSIA